jgi:hypothetical protein
LQGPAPWGSEFPCLSKRQREPVLRCKAGFRVAIVPPKYSDRSAIIEVDRFSFAPSIGATTLFNVLGALASMFKTSSQPRLENLALRQQLAVLRRSAPKRLKLTPN